MTSTRDERGLWAVGERIPLGITNEVYRSLSGDHVIKRVGRPTRAVHKSLAREAAALTLMAPILPQVVPRLIAAKTDAIAVERLQGVPLPEFRLSATAAKRRIAGSNAAALLRVIHSVDRVPEDSPLSRLHPGDSWPEQLLGSYRELSRLISASVSGLDEILSKSRSWLERNQAHISEIHFGLAHGDFLLSNLLIDRTAGTVTGVLDWEWATMGDTDLDLVRLEWMPVVGRSSALWDTSRERTAFYDGYGDSDARKRLHSKHDWYSVWFTTSYIALRLQLGREQEVRPLVRYLSRIIGDRA